MKKINDGAESIFPEIDRKSKVLDCLFLIDKLLLRQDIPQEQIFFDIINIITSFSSPEKALDAMISIDDKEFKYSSVSKFVSKLSADLTLSGSPVGFVAVFYSYNISDKSADGTDSAELLFVKSIAYRLSSWLETLQLKKLLTASQKSAPRSSRKPEWKVLLDMLKKTDHHIFSVISKKMLNHLLYKGVDDSKLLFKKLGQDYDKVDLTSSEINIPSKKEMLDQSYKISDDIFGLARQEMGDEEILSYIEKWINEEKTHFLVKALVYQNTPVSEIKDSLRRYCHINPGAEDESSSTIKGIRVALIRRFLTDQLEFINISKDYCIISDFDELLKNLIYPLESHGKLGGKTAGIYLANKILEKEIAKDSVISNFKTPKTWYITSDSVMNFIYYNNLEEVIEEKYKNIDEIRSEYPHIIQTFKNSQYPPEIVNGLSRALDDFGRNPIIVRSSSLLEDRLGSAFAGKYKSLFLANQGTKQQRLEALMDAVAEVFASTFGPDPIGYRIERGLLDFNEEMGILIQEVVGKRFGKYLFPAFAGVAFTNNEFRWSPRIDREDGLLRMVPGLGTRAVDRLSNDFPILIAPGKPELRVNLTPHEIIGYAPKHMDVINLETNTFESVSIDTIIANVGNEFPLLNEIFSIQEETHLKRPIGLGIDTAKHDIVPTFENLITNTTYIKQIHTMLKILSDKLNTPVDIEFACDGESLYLLQCRPQSLSGDSVAAVIPKDISEENLIFSANKHISNGRIPDINYIVYINPAAYAAHTEFQDLKAVGRAVGELNKILPKKKFILMGPGRWGSRDDIRLGVNVTYSDIHNTSLLIEIAKRKENYVPDLSFGTHFFQDLVEASIRYIPLYPDDEGNSFNEQFFLQSPNVLIRFLPEYAYLSDTIKVINVPETTKGKVLRILMNGDKSEAVAMLTDPGSSSLFTTGTNSGQQSHYREPLYWRREMAELLASKIDPKRFEINDIYLFGSSHLGSADANSDIDILIIDSGNESYRQEMRLWFEGWNALLAEQNFNMTGYRIENILDLHFISEDELKTKQHFADLIDPRQKTSRRLRLKDF